MTKRKINHLSYHEKLALANEKSESGSFTADALKAQEILWEDSWASVFVNNHPDPFDYLPDEVEY